MDLNIEVSEELRQAWPQFRGAAVFATVKNSPYSEELWKRIGEFTELTVRNIPLILSKRCLPFRLLVRLIRNVGKIPAVTVLLQKLYAAAC